MKLQECDPVSLQEAFERFRNKRLRQIKSTKKIPVKPMEEGCENERLSILRKKFVNQALKYLGVPYARRYHEKGSPDYDAPLYLDCCALVRRILMNMKKDLGFRIGAWNQAYQFDTLPITIEKEEDLKPGDLVFISGIYYNPKSKKQKHNMVHVEIWLGDGEKTIGARYHKGRVQIHDSYKFVAKSYHSMVYYFKSIDTWLNGICRSFCPEHPWIRSKHLNHGKSSIFALKQASESESAGDDDDNDESNSDHETTDERSIVNYTETEEKENRRLDTEMSREEISFETKCRYTIDIEECKSGVTVEETVRCSFSGLDTTPKTSEIMSNSEFSDRRSNRETSPESELLYFSRNRPEGFPDSDEIALSVALVDGLGEISGSERDSFNEAASECHYIDEKNDVVNEDEHLIKVEKNLVVSDEQSNFLQQAESEYSGCGCVRNCSCDCYDCWTARNEEGTNSGDEECFAEIYYAMKKSSSTGSSFAQTCAPGNVKKKEDSNPKQNAAERTTNGIKPSPRSRPRRSRSKSPSKSPFKVPSTSVLSTGRARKRGTAKFYIGGKNGVAYVEKPLLDKGWRRIDDGKDLTYYLKWVECKSKIDYRNFREGEQMVNHIPNGSCLTSKTGLCKSLQDYEKVVRKTSADSGRLLNLQDFYPETYKIDGPRDLENLSGIIKDGETWICKPGCLNQGKGIFLVKSLQQLRTELEERSMQVSRTRQSSRIIARYIENPLLLNGCKFDIRAYMLIASTTPYIVLYHSGYVRIACVPYSKESTDITSHLTNQNVQKKHPDYFGKKDDSIWTFEKLNEYVTNNYKESKNLPDDWVLNVLTTRMKEIMLTCFQSVEHKLERKTGYFDLLGFDFIVDDNMKVWLLEVNVNPALFSNCESLRVVMPGIVEETLMISIEAFENKCHKKKIHPMESVKTFEYLFDGERRFSFKKTIRDESVELKAAEVTESTAMKEESSEDKKFTISVGTLDGEANLCCAKE